MGNQAFLSTTFPDALLSTPGKITTLLVALILCSCGIWAAPQVVAEYESRWFVPENSDLLKTWDVLDANFGGQSSTP